MLTLTCCFEILQWNKSYVKNYCFRYILHFIGKKKSYTYFHIKVMVKLWMWLSTAPQRYIGAACKMLLILDFGVLWLQRITFILHFISPVNSLYNTTGQVQSTAGQGVGTKNKICAFFRKWTLILRWFVNPTELSLIHTSVGRNILLISKF